MSNQRGRRGPAGSGANNNRVERAFEARKPGARKGPKPKQFADVKPNDDPYAGYKGPTYRE